MGNITYTIKRSFRKTMAIRVTREGQVEVRAPKNVSRAFIDGFVLSKKDWILAALERVADVKDARDHFKIESVRLLGSEYPVKEGKEQKARFDGKRFLLPSGEIEKKEALISWYRGEAKRLLPKRVQHFSQMMGVEPAAVKISNARTRWGSCSANGNLNFTWKLLMASGEAIDYVVVHELAHLAEPNHSDRFWKIVAYYLPDYQRAQKELEELARQLEREDWQREKRQNKNDSATSFER